MESEGSDESLTHNVEVRDDHQYILSLLHNGSIPLDTLRKEQHEDPDLERLIQFKEAGNKPMWSTISSLSSDFKYYWGRWEVVHLRSGVLYRKWESSDGGSFEWQLVLPKRFRRFVFEQLHETPTSGHLGVSKTFSKIRSRYFWYAMHQDVQHWCQLCDKCASKKRTPRKARAPLQTYVVGAPLERIAVDVLGPLPTTQSGNKYLLVIGDYFTKWMDAFPINNQEAISVADVLVKNFVVLFGVPRMIHSDQGTNFESQVFREMCCILGIDKTRTTPLHPESDGMVERLIQTLETMLALFCCENQWDWDEHVHLLMMAYRSSVQQKCRLVE
ncbi:Hypothetical predicted protein [Mytilus galloprovincialis]|uniref:Integrase catalytic domain-containing protein n=1 Tax=Mytilus galloprovincialis TaxID=29158 RepID=A0A8B6CA79_MYTGA|nr:Hypothetical predicted protein [Mytilus galloprovincialis]